MTTMIRSYGAGIALSVALAGVGAACPNWPQAFGLEVGSGASARAGSHEFAPPGQACEVYKARIEAKAQIVTRLRAGDLDLFEATAWFTCVNREPPECVDVAWQYMPGASDEEKRCRQVIRWAHAHLTNGTPESELGLFVEKLEADLSARLCERGRVELPEWK